MAQSKVITLRMGPEEHEAIRDAADNSKVSMNEYLMRLIRKDLKNEVKSHTPDFVYKCTRCGRQYPTLEEYTEHNRLFHARQGNNSPALSREDKADEVSSKSSIGTQQIPSPHQARSNSIS